MRQLAAAFVVWFVLTGINSSFANEPNKPNIVILFADDMGYGDPGCYGHPSIRTPNIDSLATAGMRLTSFVTGSWCVPSRTQLITGRYMPRIAFNGNTGADGKGGLPDSEWTLPEALKDAGYRTHMIGKWHLGYKQKKFLPVNQGFDTWFGLPYSNDYKKPWVQTDEPLGLYRGEEMVEYPFDQNSLTQRYTAEATKLIDAAETGKPFLLYLAYAMPHLPLAVSDQRRNTSNFGFYGDVIEEVDWSAGQVLPRSRKKGLPTIRWSCLLPTTDPGWDCRRGCSKPEMNFGTLDRRDRFVAGKGRLMKADRACRQSSAGRAKSNPGRCRPNWSECRTFIARCWRLPVPSCRNKKLTATTWCHF